jgi:phytoene dehydrogenase-like protein
MSKSIIIIGAGMGGLSAGCYAQINGYQAKIFEMHSAPGGQCTSWTRKDYTFDGCIHNLAGTTASSAFSAMWKELGVTAPMIAYDEMISIEPRGGGSPTVVYSDLDRLQQSLKVRFPKDTREIDRLIGAARQMSKTDLLALSSANLWDRLKALALMGRLCGIGGLTLEEYAKRFADPVLREAFPHMIYDWPKQSMFMALYFLAGLDKGDLGWPQGGSGAFARAVERRFLQLGGKIEYQAKVAAILVEDGKAVGVKLTDGSEHRADIIISNAYGPTTIFNMLGGRYVTQSLRTYYARPDDVIEMGVHVSLGVARDLSKEPHAILYPLDQPVEIDGRMRDRLFIQTFGFDPTMAPAGKGVMKVLLSSSWKRWEEIARTPHRYKEEQERIARIVTALLEHRFPGIASQIEVTDVATPITTKRFTGNGPGFGFAISDMLAALFLGKRRSQTLPGLVNFYMVGQWAGMPGVPMVAAMGRDVVRDICKRDRRSFQRRVSIRFAESFNEPRPSTL